MTTCRSCGLEREPSVAVRACICGEPDARWSLGGATTPEPTFTPGDWVLAGTALVRYVGRSLDPEYSVVSDTGLTADNRVVPTKDLRRTR